MRNIGAVLLLLLTSFFAMTVPSLAQSNLRVCAGVDLTAPADGAALDPGYRTNFTWDSEPRGTASREWVSVRVDLDADPASFSFDDAKRVKAEPRLYKGFARGRPGIYAWAVIFYDAKGNPICQSEARTYVVGGSGFESLSGTSSTAAAIKAALGRYVIVLTGGGSTTYGGSAPVNRYVASNNYDDTTDADGWQAAGYTGLEIWGNANNNKITGSNLSDLIYGGNESCTGEKCNKWGHLGDEIDGGDGNDIIYGGNESCSGKLCNTVGALGDHIDGGNGDDKIYGGDESCTGDNCNFFGATGDLLHGNAGSDQVNGQGGNDIVNGGNHIIDGWVFDGSSDTLSGGTGSNIVEAGPTDVVVP